MIEEVFVQAGYYFAAMCIGIFLISIIQRGIFYPIIKVRLSFGKLILVKLRQVHRDYYKVGKIEEGFIVFGKKHFQRRIPIASNEYFYRLSGLICVDADDEKNALCKPDYSTVPGFDAVKYNNLYIRTLFKPAVSDNQDKLVLGALLLIIILVIAVGFFIYKNGYALEFIIQKLSQLAAAGKGIVIKG